MVRSKPVEHRRGRCPDRRSVTSRKRISRAGRPVAPRASAATPSAPAARHRRLAGAAPRPTGAAAPSSAQLSPPNAITLVPTAACANVDRAGRGRGGPRRRASASDQNTSDVGGEHEQQAPDAPASRAAASPAYCSSNSSVRRADEALDHPVRQAEQPQLLGRRRIDRQPVGVVGVALRLAHLVGVAVAPDARSRAAASAWRARRPPSTSGAHHA